MASDTIVRVRIDAETKDRATKALSAMGLSVSDFIRMALVRVAHDQAVPFPVKMPNALTMETLRASDKGEDIYAAKDAGDLFEKSHASIIRKAILCEIE